MPDEVLFGKAFFASAGIAALVVLLLTFPRATISAWRLQLAWIVGMGLGFGLSFAYLQDQLGGSLHWPPREALERFLLLVLPTLVGIELLAVVPRIPSWLVWGLRLALAAGLAPVLLYRTAYVTTEWSTTHLGVLAILGIVLILEWVALAALWHRTRDRSLPIALAIACCATGVVVMFSGWIGGWVALPLAAAIGGAVVFAPLGTSAARAGAPVGLGLVALFGLVMIGHFFAELAMEYAVMILASPVLVLLPQLVPTPQPNVASGSRGATVINFLLRFVRAGLRIGLIAGLMAFIVYKVNQPAVSDTTSSGADAAEVDAYRNYGK